MGFHVTGASRRRSRHLADPATGNTPASRHTSLGGPWLRNPVCGISALPDEDRAVRRRPGRHHLKADFRAWAAWAALGDWWTQHDRVPEGHHLHAAVLEVLGLGCGIRPAGRGGSCRRSAGSFMWLRPNTIRPPAWPGKVPFTSGDTRTIVDVALYAVVLVGGFLGAVRHPGRAGRLAATGDVGLVVNPRPGGADDRRPGAVAGSARQDHLSWRRAANTTGLSADRVLLPLHRSDSRLQDHHARLVVGRRDLQAQPPLPVRRVGDDEQQIPRCCGAEVFTRVKHMLYLDPVNDSCVPHGCRR